MLAAFLLLLVVTNFVGWFVSPDQGDAPGHAGNLFFAGFFLVLAGPFVAIALVLALPLFSDDPGLRNADR